MMGSKLLLGGRSENAEQSSLTDVGTLRYMAPELLDGAVNLRDCEASLKQIDIYSLGLVMWEISSRCSALYQGIPVPEYMLPYQAEAGIHPSFDEMQLVVARNKTRPKFPEVWKDTNQAIQALKETIEDCWDQDAEARLTAFCVEERIVEMISLWSQDSKHKGVTPTLIPSNIMSQPGRTDRHTYYDNIGTQTRQKNTSISDSSSPSIPVEGSTIALIINDTHTSMPLQNLSHSRVSWRNENSVSESTAETTIPMSPSDSDLPPKSDNINNARNNAVLPAHQGRNPTVERNTHKRSDEELAISGNTLVINNKLMENGEGTGTSVRDTIATDNLFETVTENLETSLVQNDVLNHHHRNPPIPYVQNHVHSESPLMRPKIANVPGNGSLVPYNRLTVNQAKSHKSRFMKFRPRDIGMKISQLGLFGRSSKHSTNTGQPQPPVAHKYGEKIQNVPNQSLYDPINLNGSAVSRHSVNVNRDGRNPNQAEVEPLLIQTEVRLQNGGPVVRPADLNAASSTQPANRNINFSRDNNSLRYPENRLGIAEVGVAKLEMRQNGYPSVCRIRGGGYSKSTSDLSPEHSCRSSKWKETDLMDVLNSKFHKRPKTLSLRGHNYNRDNKPASSSLTYLSNAANSLDVKLLSSANDDPSEKIKRRVKTPLTMKRGRFSLYDDRLMSHSCDNFAKKANANVTRSSVSLHHIKC